MSNYFGLSIVACDSTKNISSETLAVISLTYIPKWSNFIGPYLKIPVLSLLPELKEQL